MFSPATKFSKHVLKKLEGVQNVTISSYIPGVSKTSGTAFAYLPDGTDSLIVNWISTDYNYLATYGIKLKKGRYFFPKYATASTQAVVLNEAAAHKFHLESPLGKYINGAGFIGERKVIGVTHNFNFLSLYQKIPPIIFIMYKPLYFNFSVKITATSTPSTVIANIKQIWQSMLPGVPFHYEFVSQQFNALYKTDRQMDEVFGVFAVLSLFILCLGPSFQSIIIYGISKAKGIGIRKVFGATTNNILFSFYKNYGKRVGLACIIAVPASYFFLKGWLQNFAFRIGMPIWVFWVAIVAALFIACLAVSFESFKASITNPAESISQ